jgi:predicted MFS family arabinose efflux permease
MGAGGLGALTGALILATRTGREAERLAAEGKGELAEASGLARPLLASCGLGAALMALECAHSTLVAAPLLFAIGGCLMVVSTASGTIIQTLVEPDKIGRVMSLYAIGFFAGAPVGALLEGELAKLVGPVHMFAIAGAGCVLSGLLVARELRRPHSTLGPPRAPEELLEQPTGSLG